MAGRVLQLVSRHRASLLYQLPQVKAKTWISVPTRECFSQGRRGKSKLQSFKSILIGDIQQRFESTVLAADASEVSEKGRKIVGYWLLGCCGMVVGAVSLGGVTRLTESGLSMTDWHLIRGMKPPRSQKEWEEEFAKYQNFPEYKYARQGMTLGEFKFIFYMEWAHRMWGRTVGLAFLLPAIYFWRKGWFNKGMKPRVLVFGSLLLGQGLLGWYMVQSGLKEETMGMSTTAHPHVSQYRLAGHLGMAFTLYSGMFWQALSHLTNPAQFEKTSQLARFGKWAHGCMALVFFTALSGAFVAGLDAGLVYNSFPKMADRWIPDDLWAQTPWYKNIFENPTTTQFNHRILGTTTLASIIAVWCLARPVALPYRARLAVNCLLGVSFMQVGMGIATLLTYVPTTLAAFHQLGSLTLLTTALWLNHELKGGKIPK